MYNIFCLIKRSIITKIYISIAIGGTDKSICYYLLVSKIIWKEGKYLILATSSI